MTKINRDRFHEIFAKGASLVDSVTLARELRVSLSTIKRWKTGESAPHELGRESVLSETFRLAVQDVPNKLLARKFGISRPSVERWKSGQNAPFYSMIEVVFDDLLMMRSVDFIPLSEELKAALDAPPPTITLSNRDRDRLLSVLENPPAPNEALKKAAEANKDLLTQESEDE